MLFLFWSSGLLVGRLAGALHAEDRQDGPEGLLMRTTERTTTANKRGRWARSAAGEKASSNCRAIEILGSYTSRQGSPKYSKAKGSQVLRNGISQNTFLGHLSAAQKLIHPLPKVTSSMFVFRLLLRDEHRLRDICQDGGLKELAPDWQAPRAVP